MKAITGYCARVDGKWFMINDIELTLIRFNFSLQTDDYHGNTYDQAYLNERDGLSIARRVKRLLYKNAKNVQVYALLGNEEMMEIDTWQL